MKNKKRVLIISCFLILVLLFTFVFCFLGCETRLVYSDRSCVVIDGIEYSCSDMSKTCTVSTIILDPNVKTVEISIPDKLDDGTLVEGVGHITKGKDFFYIEMDGLKIQYSYLNDDSEEVTDYFVTIRLGKNIKIASCLLNLNEETFQVENTDEYIRINITYEVSPDNKWYYSENGKLYEKEGAGFFESSRLFRVWQARKDD